MTIFVTILHWLFLIGAVVVLPLVYFGVRAWLDRAAIQHPPHQEVFVAFGTLGGWMLTCALSPSPFSLPCGAFTFFVAFPASLFFILRMVWRRKEKSVYHRFALIALSCGLLVPVSFTGIAFLLSL